MDHHCDFLGCWIGFNNHKHFVLFTFYISVELAFLLIVYLHAITVFKFGSDSVAKLVLGYIVPILVLMPVFVFTFFLFVTHFVFDLLNVTKLEYNISFKCRPFDTKHSFLNFKESFGDPKFKGLWLLPVDPGSWSKTKQDNNLDPLGPRTGIKKKDGHQFFYRVPN